MSMATLNILLPTPSTNSHYFNANYSQSSHNVYFNTNNNSNNHTKLHSLPCSHSLPLLSSLFVQTKSNPSHKFSHMPTHLSKSGNSLNFVLKFQFLVFLYCIFFFLIHGGIEFELLPYAAFLLLIVYKPIIQNVVKLNNIDRIVR